MARKTAPVPNESCFCGCGEKVPRDSFFARGHDKRADSMLTKLRYGQEHPIAARLASHGFGGKGKNLKDEYEALEKQAASVWSRRRSR